MSKNYPYQIKIVLDKGSTLVNGGFQIHHQLFRHFILSYIINSILFGCKNHFQSSRQMTKKAVLRICYRYKCRKNIEQKETDAHSFIRASSTTSVPACLFYMSDFILQLTNIYISNQLINLLFFLVVRQGYIPSAKCSTYTLLCNSAI